MYTQYNTWGLKKLCQCYKRTIRSGASSYEINQLNVSTYSPLGTLIMKRNHLQWVIMALLSLAHIQAVIITKLTVTLKLW